MKIYCCHSISGMSADEVFTYYEDTDRVLQSFGYDVLSPMHGKDMLRTEKEFRAADYRHPVTANHAIFNRDHWMVCQSDVVYANLMGTKAVSIGTMMELAWASHTYKHVVLCMENDNVHRHAFVLEACDIVFDNEQDTLQYLKGLIGIKDTPFVI